MVKVRQRGTKTNYKPDTTHKDVIYITTDTNEILLNGTPYIIDIEDTELDSTAKLLTYNGGPRQGKWSNLANVIDLKDILAYGVQWDITVADPHLTRVGNLTFHKTLPIQSKMAGCISQGNVIQYWLDPEDWRFRKEPEYLTDDDVIYGAKNNFYDLTIQHSEFSDNRYEGAYIRVTVSTFRQFFIYQIKSIDANTATCRLVEPLNWTEDEELSNVTFNITKIELGSVLNGYDGTVRVYVPKFYIRSFEDGNTRSVYISEHKVDDTWYEQPEILIDAYRSTVLNTVPDNMGYLSTLPVNSAISVVNTNSYCRGGDNRSGYDGYLSTDQFRTDLGKPRTSISRATMRTYSRNAGNYMMSYNEYKNIFYWLYVIEYANFNSQEAYNEELTTEGYKQGGLGDGVTDWTNAQYYYNLNYPITPCGYGNTLGNKTGLTDLVIPESTKGTYTIATHTFHVPRWRSFDNPFGDICTNLDGSIVDANYSRPYVYMCSDRSKYADTLSDAYEEVGRAASSGGYTKTFDLGNAAHIIPNSIGASTTTYMCDQYWKGDMDRTLRTICVGGDSTDGADAGLGYFGLNFYVGDELSYIGFRTVSPLQISN